MADNSDTFIPPMELKLPVSTSNCSMDMSVLSVGSSFNSIGSMSQAYDHKPQKRLVHRKKHSAAKFNSYRSYSGQWNESHGSGMNLSLHRSQSRTSQSLLSPSFPRRVSRDVPAHVPFRKASQASLPSKKAVQDGPAHVPVRKASLTYFEDSNSSSKAQFKNFEWKFSSSPRRVSKEEKSLAASGLVGCGFSFNPSNPFAQTNQPPTIPQRKESQPQFTDCTEEPSSAREENYMDFDHASTPEGCEAMPPPLFNRNKTWSANPKPRHKEFLGNNSDRYSGKDLFMAMPPITRFERASGHPIANSSFALPPLPQRRGSDMTDDQQSAVANTIPFNRMSPPPVPKRKESYMDINDSQ